MVKGVAMQKAKRKPVLSQLMAVIEVSKYSEAVIETGAKESHCCRSQSVSASLNAIPRAKGETYIPTNYYI